MPAFERFLLLGIIFLLIVRTAFFTEDIPRLENNPDAVRSGDHGDFNTPSGVIGAPATETPEHGTAFDWNPASFDRRGIPKKLTLAPDGRIPEIMRLNDTQKAFVYATMVETYDVLLTRARDECPQDVKLDVTRWQARHARTIADARTILDILAPGRDTRRKVRDGMPAILFQKRICHTVDHYLRTGAYEPHREAVARLAHAARGAKPE